MAKRRLFCSDSDSSWGDAAPPKVGTLARIPKNIAARHQNIRGSWSSNHPVDTFLNHGSLGFVGQNFAGRTRKINSPRENFLQGNLQRLADHIDTLKESQSITSNIREGFVNFDRPDSLSGEVDPSDRNQVLELLTQRIAQLSWIPKKVLAMYYYENLQLPEIAAGLGLTESETELILTQTVRLLRNKLVADLKQFDRSS